MRDDVYRTVHQGLGFSIERATNIDLVKEILIASFNTDKEKEIVRNTKAKDMYELITDIELEHGLTDGISFAIAEWMTTNKEINPKRIRFIGYASEGAYETEETVMFPMMHPWHYTYEERNITEGEIEFLLQEFAKLLGVRLREICYQELQYEYYFG